MNTPPIGPSTPHFINESEYRLNYFITNPTLNNHPPTLVWTELLLAYYPQAMNVFNTLTDTQKREAIEILKEVRKENWREIILHFISLHDLDYSHFLNALSDDERASIASIINFNHLEPLALLLKRTGGDFQDKIAVFVWLGSASRFFSHHLFTLFYMVEGSQAFDCLQGFVNEKNASRMLPAIKEDVDILLKWILSASKSCSAAGTLRALAYIYVELNDNQKRRLITRSVRFYPETFLYIMTLLTENEAKMICRQNIYTMPRFLEQPEERCRELIPQNRDAVIQPLLTKARFRLRNTAFHPLGDIFNVLEVVPGYEKEDYDNIDSIPPFLFCFFESWKQFRRKIKLIINDLNEPQLKALSLGITRTNAQEILSELEGIMDPRGFSRFLAFFRPELIDPYLTHRYNGVARLFEAAESAINGKNEVEVCRLNLLFIQYRQSPVLRTVLTLLNQLNPSSQEYVERELDRHMKAFQDYLASKKRLTAESERSLYKKLSQNSDRAIGLLDDEDLKMLGIADATDSSLLDQYRSQPRLVDSWKILNKRRIYKLKELEEHCLLDEPCLIASENQCFKLYELAIKLV